jgi:1,4-dihydroxy-2-naphthoyl-CoA hydrolase
MIRLAFAAVDSSWQTLMPAGWEPVVPFEACFDAQFGLEVLDHDVAGEGVVRARVVVGDAQRNQHGLVHGGVFAAAAEALASRGTALVVMPHGQIAAGLSNDTSVLADVREGELRFEAKLQARDDDAWLWTVDAHDGGDRLCAHSRVTVAVRNM